MSVSAPRLVTECTNPVLLEADIARSLEVGVGLVLVACGGRSESVGIGDVPIVEHAAQPGGPARLAPCCSPARWHSLLDQEFRRGACAKSGDMPSFLSSD